VAGARCLAAGKSNDFIGWLNETVGSVSSQPRRNNQYSSVSTKDDDD